MRIFKSKWFARFARKNRIDDSALRLAVSDMEAGNFDAGLGGCVCKQRVARQGRGKRGGYRAIALFKQGERAFFVFGFAKNKLDNIGDNDLELFRRLTKKHLSETDGQIRSELEEGALIEITPEV
jgi:hypothetical protein